MAKSTPSMHAVSNPIGQTDPKGAGRSKGPNSWL